MSGRYTSVPPTLEEGATNWLQLDQHGNLKVTSDSISATTEGVYNVTTPVLTNGTSSPIQMDSSGNTKVVSAANDGIDIGDVTVNNAAGAPIPVQLGDPTNQVTIDSGAAFDSRSNTRNCVPTNGYLYAYNGTNWDRVRSGAVGVNTTFTGFLNTAPLLRYKATPITMSDGDMAPFQSSSSGELKTLSKIWDGTTTAQVDGGAASDARSNTRSNLGVNSFPYGYNGSTWDRIRTGAVGVQTTFTGFQNTLPLARYNASLPTPADGNAVNFQVNANSQLRVAVETITAPTAPGAFQLAVGTSSVQLTSTAVTQGITIKADDDNTDSIYVGIATGVTTSTGYRLKAGQSVFVGCSNANLLWAISGAVSQKIHVIGS